MTNTVQLAETWLNGFAHAAQPVFAARGYDIPANLRVRIGLPTEGYRSRKMADYIAPEYSADGSHEIYISPKNSAGDASIAALVTIQLCRACVGIEAKNSQVFKDALEAVGMTGKASDPTTSDDWTQWALPVLTALGPMDFAAISADVQPTKKATTYLHPITCPDCGWKAQITKSHVHPHPYLDCPVPDCGGTLYYVGAEGEASEEQ